MSSLVGEAQFDSSFNLNAGARQAVLVAAALATAAAIAAFGALSLAMIPAAAAVVAILANPEWGMYALFFALAFPVPMRAGDVVLYPHDAAAVLTIVSSLIFALRRRSLALPRPYFLLPAACLFFSQVISLVNARDLTRAGVEIGQQFYLLLIVPTAYFLLLRDERILHRIIKAFMALATAEALLACAQFLLMRAGSRWLIDVFAFGRYTFRGSRVFGTIGPTLGLLLVASSFLWIRGNLRWSWKLPIVAVHMFAILATGTRSVMLIFFITLIFYALFTRRKGLGLKMMIVALAGALVFVSVVGLSRFSQSLVHVSDSRYRFPIDTKALKAVPRHPVIGHGPKAASALSISIFGARKIGVENEFVARLYNNGALGLAALLACGSIPVLCSVREANRKHPAAQLAATAGAVIVGMYSGGPAGCIFEGSLGQWAMIFYAVMLAATQISNSRNPDHPPAGEVSCFHQANTEGETRNVSNALQEL